MKERYSNPYVIGAILGLTLLFCFYTMGRGLGSSSSFARIATAGVNLVAPEHAKANAYYANYLRGGVARGPSIGVSIRLWLALGGGILSGFAARLARGCTSGQALTGASELAVGSWVFMLCIFAGAYGMAYFFKKEWL